MARLPNLAGARRHEWVMPSRPQRLPIELRWLTARSDSAWRPSRVRANIRARIEQAELLPISSVNARDPMTAAGPPFRLAEWPVLDLHYGVSRELCLIVTVNSLEPASGEQPHFSAMPAPAILARRAAIASSSRLSPRNMPNPGR
jgi:hypothetical protein